MQRQAVQLAIAAYDTAPDYVPASDGIIRMQLTTHMMWDWMSQSVASDIMETTPNYGTLVRLSHNSNVNWGGGGQRDIIDLCNAYFDKIPEYPDLTIEICLAALFVENDMLDGNWAFITDVLARIDHELLTMARLERALARQTDEDHQLVMDYLNAARFDEPWISGQYRIARVLAANQWHLVNEEIDDFFDEFGPRLRAELMAELARNPFHLPLLHILIRDENQRTQLIQPDPLEMHNFKLRRAVLQPYHIANWNDARPPFVDPGNPSFLNTFDTTYYNAIAYSDHNVFVIKNLLQDKIRQYQRFRDPIGTWGFGGWPEPPEDELISEIGCRVGTLIRLFDDAATRQPDSVNSIEGFRINNDLDSIEADIRTLDACDYVWETTIEDLKFDPIEIDRRSLLIIPESTPFAPSLERFERDAAKTDQ